MSNVDLTPAAQGDAAPSSLTARELFAMASAAFAVRVVLAVALMALTHRSLAEWASLRDGESYLRLARAVHGEMNAPTAFDWRVFMGYPFAIGALSWTGIPFPLSALLLAWSGAGISAALSAALTRRRDVGWAMALVLPGYLMYTSLAMSEGLLLACILGGLLLGVRGHPVLGGILLGYAGLVRPMACFAVLGYVVYCLHRRELRAAFSSGLIALTIVGTGTYAWRAWSGGAAKSVALYKSAYGGRLVDWPFATLVETPWLSATPTWKIIYIYAHVALVLAGCALAVREWLRVRHDGHDAPFAALIAAWLVGNTIFAVCVGQYWGFHEFHRFIVPALPALWFALRRFLPRRRVAWLALSAGSIALAAFGVAH